MRRPRRKVSPRRFDRWYTYRYDQLLLEGFTPEEAARLATVRISIPTVRAMRRRRKAMVQRLIDEGMDRRDAILRIRDRIAGSEWEVTWRSFRRLVYPRST